VALEESAPPAVTTLPAHTRLLGFWGGCPLLYAYQSGIWRACDDAGQSRIPDSDVGGFTAAVSSDGRFVATHDDGTRQAILWSLEPERRPLRAFGTRAEETDVRPLELPYAVTAGGARVLTGALPANLACYAGPGFTLRVQDGASGAVLDELPPWPTLFPADPSGIDEDATRIAYGTQLWCAR
jgi:hypothetical protein